MDERFLAYRLDSGSYQLVAALEADRIRVKEPMVLEFSLDLLIGR